MDHSHTKCCVESESDPGYDKEHFFLLRRRHGTAPLHSIRQVKPRIWSSGRLVPAPEIRHCVVRESSTLGYTAVQEP